MAPINIEERAGPCNLVETGSSKTRAAAHHLKIYPFCTHYAYSILSNFTEDSRQSLVGSTCLHQNLTMDNHNGELEAFWCSLGL